MTTHALKCWPICFDAIVSGARQFDVRKDDRNFRVGDTVQLREWELQAGTYTGRQTWRDITSVHPVIEDDPPVAAIARGYIVLGLGPIPVPHRAPVTTSLRPSFSAVPPRPSGVAWEPEVYCYAEVTPSGGLYVRREIEAVHVLAFLAWATAMFPDLLRGASIPARETYEP